MTAPVSPQPQIEIVPASGLRVSLFYGIVVMVFVADQFSKAWITRNQMVEESRPLLGRAFQLTLTHNHGGAWGVLPQGNTLFIVFAFVAIIALLVAYHRMAKVELIVGAAFALALGGAFGNLFDRLRFGFVVDFFDARFINFPIFNIADSAITIGIGLLIYHFIISSVAESRANAPSVVAPAAALTGSRDSASGSTIE